MKTHRIGLLVVAGIVAAAIVAPVSQAAPNNRVQLASGASHGPSGIGTGGIAAIAGLGIAVALAATSTLIFRHRRRLVTA